MIHLSDKAFKYVAAHIITALPFMNISTDATSHYHRDTDGSFWCAREALQTHGLNSNNYYDKSQQLSS